MSPPCPVGSAVSVTETPRTIYVHYIYDQNDAHEAVFDHYVTCSQSSLFSRAPLVPTSCPGIGIFFSECRIHHSGRLEISPAGTDTSRMSECMKVISRLGATHTRQSLNQPFPIEHLHRLRFPKLRFAPQVSSCQTVSLSDQHQSPQSSQTISSYYKTAHSVSCTRRYPPEFWECCRRSWTHPMDRLDDGWKFVSVALRHFGFGVVGSWKTSWIRVSISRPVKQSQSFYGTLSVSKRPAHLLPAPELCCWIWTWLGSSRMTEII